MDSRELVARVARVIARHAVLVAMVIARRGPAVARVVAIFLGRWVLRIAFPVAGAVTMLHLFPYYTSAAGLHLRVQGTLLNKPGISADTTIGNWEFPNVDGLPIGVHITPENVDLIALSNTANANGQAFADQFRRDLNDQVPTILWWLGGELLLGVLIGLAVTAGANLALRYLRGQTRVPHRVWIELRHRGLQLGAALTVVALIAAYGGLTYNSRWSKQSRLTGTLGAVQLVPGQLEQFYNHQSKAYDVISAISGIQAELQQQIGSGSQSVADTAFNIMYISDMHLASTYPLVAQYAANFNVKLIVNTGDETEFGTAYDLTPAYIDQISALTKTVPMIWVAGNHDSPGTVETMSTIPGVTVLGTKTARASGYQVTAQYADADGLIIAGVPDPRVYGAAGAYGSDKDSETDPLEKSAVDGAVKDAPKSLRFDIFATHEPVAAHELTKELPDRIRQLNSGHTHAQNDVGQVQSGSTIDLVEGSTGAGGLDAIGSSPPPIEFSIESVAADCQFTKVVRFQLRGAGDQVTASTIYLKPQKLDPARLCSASLAVSTAHDLTAPVR